MNTKTLLKRIAFVVVASSFMIACEDAEIAPAEQGNELQDSELMNDKSGDHSAKKAPLVLLGGTQGIFRASELGETFVASSGGLSGNALIAQAFLHKHPRIYAGTKDGVYASKDGGKTWYASNNGMTGAGLNVVALYERENIIYAGTFGGGVYKSKDGKNWTTLNSGLTNLRLVVRAFAEHNGKLYIGTHNGVYRLSTDGTTWRTVTTGLVGPSSRTVVGLASWNGSLYAATFGGALKELKDGKNWTTLYGEGLTDGFVNAVVAVDDKLYVGGNNEGVFIYDGTTFTPSTTGLPPFLRIRAFAVNGNEVLMSTINSGTYYTTDGVTWIANAGEVDNADYWGLLFQ